MIQQKVTIELQNLFLQSIIDSQLYLVTLVIYILMPFDKVKDSPYRIFTYTMEWSNKDVT